MNNEKNHQALKTSSTELPIILYDLRSKHTKPISQSSLSSQAKKGWLKDKLNVTCGYLPAVGSSTLGYRFKKTQTQIHTQVVINIPNLYSSHFFDRAPNANTGQFVFFPANLQI